MISTDYDPEADALYVRMAPRGTAIVETREVEPGIMLDIGSDGLVIGIEVLGVHARSGSRVAPASAA